MENNENEKKPKRPRIGQAPAAASDGSFARYEKVNYGSRPAPRDVESGEDGSERPAYQQRSYGQRQQGSYGHRNNQGGYYNNNNGYNGGNSYNRPAYQPRPRADYARQEGIEGDQAVDKSDESSSAGGYQPRYNNYNRQGGYNNQNRQGGYNNQNRQGGYYNQTVGRLQQPEPPGWLQ